MSPLRVVASTWNPAFERQRQRDVAVLAGNRHPAHRQLVGGVNFDVAIRGLDLQVAGDVFQVNVLGARDHAAGTAEITCPAPNR